MEASDDYVHAVKNAKGKETCSFSLNLGKTQHSPAPSSPQTRHHTVSGEGRARWLEDHWFPARRRKNPSLRFSAGESNGIRIEGPVTPGETASDFEMRWKRQLSSALKKIETEDLGNMNATTLRDSIPEEDPEGRGARDLRDLERRLSVTVVFCENGHVLLVGQEAKLQKKCFEIRNILSHYHWRLSGTDVAFKNMTGTK
mmetsp:Transcript_26890/g.53709  ORF Transcript_26890/g.53709 Transcript_26890/m.53709 type:complete len:200 (-) Transcript_26890:95-694(-)